MVESLDHKWTSGGGGALIRTLHSQDKRCDALVVRIDPHETREDATLP